MVCRELGGPGCSPGVGAARGTHSCRGSSRALLHWHGTSCWAGPLRLPHKHLQECRGNPSSASSCWAEPQPFSQTPSEGIPAHGTSALLTNIFRGCKGNPSSAFLSFFLRLSFEISIGPHIGSPGMVYKCPVCEGRQKATVWRAVLCLVWEFYERK